MNNFFLFVGGGVDKSQVTGGYNRGDNEHNKYRPYRAIK